MKKIFSSLFSIKSLIITLLFTKMAYSQKNKNIQDYLNDIKSWDVVTTENKDHLEVQLSYTEKTANKLHASYVISLSEFDVENNNGEKQYVLKRDAGSAILVKNDLYNFNENPEFRKYLESLMTEKVPSGLLLAMTLGNMGYDEVKVLQKEKFVITVESLLILSSKRMNAASIQERLNLIKKYNIKNTGVEALVVVSDLGIDTAYIEMLESFGYSSLTSGDIIAAKSGNINKEYIQSINSLGYNVSFSSLIVFKSMQITADWIAETNKKQGRKLSFNELIQLRELARTRR